MKSSTLVSLTALLSLAVSGAAFSGSQWNPNESSVAEDASLLASSATLVKAGGDDLNPNESSVMEDVLALDRGLGAVDIAAMEYIPGSRTAPSVSDGAFSYHIIKQNF